jgi:predicted Zn-dependent protease with MMP-like domain
VQRDAFERLVAEALASIPRRFKKAMQNIAIVVEDEPSRELLDEMEIELPDTLLGLYQGTPLTERSWGYGNTLPDRVLIFQGPHEREAEDEDDLVVSIGETLIHEIGHYFGMSEEEIEEIEEKYWRGGADE